jgi:CheY-like chemotaxis protein
MDTGEQAKTLKSAVRTLAGNRPKDRSVLLVESDPDLQWGLARMLTVNGNRVVGTSSGEGALAVVEQWRPDVALVSSCLPRMTGVEIARRLRAGNPDLLVILMEDPSPEQDTRDPSPAVSARLPRPFRFEALRAILDSLQLAPAPAE